jgi:hypothetical protein
MEIREAGHRAFRVYYVRGARRLHGVSKGGGGGCRSAFVTGRTLFCIELIRGNAKHVVALDAHAMKNRARDRHEPGRALRRRRACLGARGFGSHKLILAREGWLANRRHPNPGGEHLSSVWDKPKFLMKNASSEEQDHRLFAPAVIQQARFSRCVYVRHGAYRKPRGPG